MFKLTGSLKVDSKTVQVSDKFSKREFVVTENSNIQYPQDIQFQLTQDKCNLLDGVNIGDEIEVSFNLRGREWNSPAGETKYFNSLEAWKIDVKSKGAAYVPVQQPQPTAQAPITEMPNDLPF